MNYHKIEKCSVANGKGVRVVLWCSGCSLHCKECHNPQTWDRNSGKIFDKCAKQELFEALNKPYIKGVTFSGGHPLEDYNFDEILDICQEIKQKFADKDIWCYTGYTFEEIYNSSKSAILPYIDVLVDGKYIDEQRDITLPFCGSKNQRVIDVPKTLSQNKVVVLTF